jgi:hypothetical protein
MSAAQYELNIEAGAKLAKTFLYTDSDGVAIPLTGKSGRMQIREDVSADAVLHEMTTANGGLIFEAGAVIGQIEMYIGATDTEAFTWSTGCYDLEIVNDIDADDVIRLLEGGVSVVPNVTRP